MIRPGPVALRELAVHQIASDQLGTELSELARPPASRIARERAHPMPGRVTCPIATGNPVARQVKLEPLAGGNEAAQREDPRGGGASRPKRKRVGHHRPIQNPGRSATRQT